MKRLLTSLLILISVTVSAQTFVKEVEAGKRIELNYSYKMRGDVPVQGSGKAIIQFPCFKTEGNGLRIISDGKTRWTMDLEAKEVYIEFGDDYEKGYIQILDKMRFIKENKDSVAGTYRNSDKEFEFNLTNIRKTEKVEGDVSEFRLDVKTLDKSWIVTDLR